MQVSAKNLDLLFVYFLYSFRYLSFRKYPLSATFQEFVSYLLDPKNADLTKDVIDHGPLWLKYTNVRHWQAYYWLTYPCHIKYDVIAHMETIDEDARFE